MDLLQGIVKESCNLPLVPLAGVTEYQKVGPEMINQVDTELEKLSNIQQLIGNNPLQVMFDNHRHHWAFMATVFGISGYELLTRTVPWVYKSYHSHGFTYVYFLAELKAWKRAVAEHMHEEVSSQILHVYDWMLAKHEQMIEIAALDDKNGLPINPNWLAEKDSFKAKLLEGDFSACMEISRNYINDKDRVKDFYLQIIQPSMYEIGSMWERAEISVAQEHLASAVVSRILACIAGEMKHVPKKKGRAVVTAAPGEFHEIGAWMVSDILEQDGWQISYLGANTPEQDLLHLLGESLPDMLVISVTMPFNLDKVKALVSAIRDRAVHGGMKILVGGRVFIDNPELEKAIGADGFAFNLDGTLSVSRSWQSR